jgi:hypothetical protein
MEEEVGGTKIQRKPPQQQQMPNPQQMQSQEIAYQQQMMQQQMAQQQMMQQQMAQQQMGGGHPQVRQQQMEGQPQMIPPQVVNQPKVGPEPAGPVGPVKSNFARIKSKFGADSSKSENNLKYSLIVALIFVLLNSKFIWKQLMKLPFMGTVEPSIVALIINSILAGVIFYIISTFLLGN